MIKMFEVEKFGTYGLNVYSRNHCNEKIIYPTREFESSRHCVSDDTIKSFLKEIPGVYAVEQLNPYFLRLSFGRLFPYEEIKEKVENIYWYVTYGDKKEFNSERERFTLKHRIINERSYRTNLSRNQERCVGCCLCH